MQGIYLGKNKKNTIIILVTLEIKQLYVYYIDLFIRNKRYKILMSQ